MPGFLAALVNIRMTYEKMWRHQQNRSWHRQLSVICQVSYCAISDDLNLRPLAKVDVPLGALVDY